MLATRHGILRMGIMPSAATTRAETVMAEEQVALHNKS